MLNIAFWSNSIQSRYFQFISVHLSPIQSIPWTLNIWALFQIFQLEHREVVLLLNYLEICRFPMILQLPCPTSGSNILHQYSASTTQIVCFRFPIKILFVVTCSLSDPCLCKFEGLFHWPIYVTLLQTVHLTYLCLLSVGRLQTSDQPVTKTASRTSSKKGWIPSFCALLSCRWRPTLVTRSF